MSDLDKQAQEQDMKTVVVFSLVTIVAVTVVLVLLYGWLGLLVTALLVVSTAYGLMALAKSGWFGLGREDLHS